MFKGAWTQKAGHAFQEADVWTRADVRDVLGKMPLKDKGGRSRRTRGQPSACDAGVTPVEGEWEGDCVRRVRACSGVLRKSRSG